MKKTIRVIAPSAPVKDKDALLEAKKLWESRGYTICMENIFRRTREESFLNGSDEERSQELISALYGEEDIIWLAAGGCGLTRILSYLPQKIDIAPKTIIGFSDGCALLAFAYKNYGWKGIHGPLLWTLIKEPPEVIEAIDKYFCSQMDHIIYPKMTLDSTQVVQLEGTIIPMNLTILTELIGTPWMISLKNSILMLEDVKEPTYKVDRMLTHLYNAGSLEGLKSIIMGRFSYCEASAGKDAERVIADFCHDKNIPLFKGFPFGHWGENWPIQFGTSGHIVCENNTAHLILNK